MSNGWIKLYRKTLDNPIVMKDGDHLAIWIYLLLHVVYQPEDRLFGSERITLEPGQEVFTLTQISEDLGVSKSKCKRVLDEFVSETQVKRETSNKNTLISIVGWDKYQGDETQDETQVKHDRNASETQVKNLHIYKETKKGRNKENKADFSSIYEDAPVELHEAMKAFEEMRLSMRGTPFTENAFRLIMNKVNKLSGGDIGKSIEILNQSVMNSWKGVFELKQEKKPVNDVSIWDC